MKLMVSSVTKMSNRHQVREKAVQTIFQLIRPQVPVSLDQACAFALEAGNDPEAGFEGSDAYLDRLVQGVNQTAEELDQRISHYLSEDWTLDRLARIDLAILRLAFYELLYVSEDEVPSKVAVNEAVELAKTFSDDKSKQFINGVLAGLLKDLKN